MADTLKAQYTAFLTRGRVLYSDMGRVLCSIVGDSCGWHDTISGLRRRRGARARKFGEGSYQELRNDFHRNTRDNFLVELGKHGLGKRDLVANVNFFVKVAADGEGAHGLARRQQPRPAPTSICASRWTRWWCCRTRPHPLDPAPTLRAAAGRARSSAAASRRRADDPCRCSRPENARGFALTEAYAARARRAGSTAMRRHDSA